ncbi:MAG: chemotaxis protein CheW [Deltaproteobacteria bacterium]|nr:chemotaxis protein CheW [Deltaproteobacteria bacterium]
MSADDERALAFEIGGMAFSLPLRDVREVTDLAEIRSVPTLPRALVGITNHRGDALPVVAASALLGVGAASDARQILVLGGNGDEPPQMGLPVDRILGLAEAPQGRRDPHGVARERAMLDERTLNVLDVTRLLELAGETIGRARQRP